LIPPFREISPRRRPLTRPTLVEMTGVEFRLRSVEMTV